MKRINFVCFECDNECRLSLRSDSSDIPKECPIDNNDDVAPEWEIDDETGINPYLLTGEELKRTESARKQK